MSLESAIEDQQASDKAKSIESDPIDLFRSRLNLSLEAAIENQEASDKAKSIESDPIDLFVDIINWYAPTITNV